jgi:hypothetical protein
VRARILKILDGVGHNKGLSKVERLQLEKLAKKYEEARANIYK